MIGGTASDNVTEGARDQWCVNDSQTHAVHTYAGGRELECSTAGQSNHAVLGRIVGR
jgi:hypothetical protein